MPSKTIFQKIIDREIPAKIEYEDERCIVIKDHNPKAPIHLLIVPKHVIERIGAAKVEDCALLGHLLYVASMISQKLELENGFRLVINNGTEGGETVPHLHIHLLAGIVMGWPPFP
jgi:histidine triad (HIT) family protein